MQRLIWVIILILFITGNLYGQEDPDACDYVPPKQGDNWFFYKNIGLIFNEGTIQLNNLEGNYFLAGKGSAVMSDGDGSLMLFTNGEKVWNRGLWLMTNGEDLMGSSGATQSSLIVPQPGNTGLYYIFTVDLIVDFPDPHHGFRYSIADMNIDNGLGAIIEKNNLLLDITSEKLTGTYHANKIDYWVVTHGWESNTFYAYLLTEESLETPVTSNSGAVQGGDPQLNNSVGYMKFSPEGNRLAQAVYGLNIVEIFNFDKTSGAISLYRQIQGPSDILPYGIEFSPNGDYLYISVHEKSSGDENILYQYDIANDNFIVLNEDASQQDVTALQVASDGKIYVARYESDSMGVIENPNRPGLECNYENAGLYVQNESVLGTPNFVQSYFDIPDFSFINHCYGDTAQFKILNTANAEEVFWDFNDYGLQDTSSLFNPSYTFTQPGDFEVSLTKYFNSIEYTETENVRIYPLPDVKISGGVDTIYMYPGSKFTLDAGPDYSFYYWYDGQGNELGYDRYYLASDTGIYCVTVVDTNCCWNDGCVWILPSQIYIPNAFTPNSDGLNDKFNVTGNVGAIRDFQLVIYNRWGQLVFTGTTPDYSNGWDGTYKGSPSVPGVYVYKIIYNIELDFGTMESFSEMGTVTLLR